MTRITIVSSAQSPNNLKSLNNASTRPTTKIKKGTCQLIQKKNQIGGSVPAQWRGAEHSPVGVDYYYLGTTVGINMGKEKPDQQ
jgi:hypothetical protein